MRHGIHQISPFLIGALAGVVLGSGFSKHGKWPNAGYAILEMSPLPRNFAFLGLLLLGAGVGGALTSMFRHAAETGFQFTAAEAPVYAWQKVVYTRSLSLAGLAILWIVM